MRHLLRQAERSSQGTGPREDAERESSKDGGGGLSEWVWALVEAIIFVAAFTATFYFGYRVGEKHGRKMEREWLKYRRTDG